MSDTNAFVAAVEKRIEEVLAGEEGGILAEASRQLCLRNGKRIRARLVRLLGDAAETPEAGLVDVAVTGELMHAASLLHDDVVDDGHLRRGKPTANARWGNAVAVLAGDWLLSTAFSLLAPYPRAITSEAIEVLRKMSLAAMLEIESRGRVDLTLETWRTIAEGKTGELFAWCGRATAKLAGREDLADPFARFGMGLGVAFQLADDLKDLWGGEPGKDRFSDLKNRNPSMPILVATQRSAALRERVALAWSRGDLVPADEVASLGEAIIASGAEQAVAVGLAREAEAAVEALGAHRNQPWCEELVRLASSFGPVDGPGFEATPFAGPPPAATPASRPARAAGERS